MSIQLRRVDIEIVYYTNLFGVLIQYISLLVVLIKYIYSFSVLIQYNIEFAHMLLTQWQLFITVNNEILYAYHKMILGKFQEICKKNHPSLK